MMRGWIAVPAPAMAAIWPASFDVKFAAVTAAPNAVAALMPAVFRMPSS